MPMPLKVIRSERIEGEDGEGNEVAAVEAPCESLLVVGELRKEELLVLSEESELIWVESDAEAA